MRSSQTYMRSRVLEAEQGICQQCGLHAHDLFLKVRNAPPSQRKEMLENTWLSQLSLKEVRRQSRHFFVCLTDITVEARCKNMSVSLQHSVIVGFVLIISSIKLQLSGLMCHNFLSPSQTSTDMEINFSLLSTSIYHWLIINNKQ